MAIDRQSDGLMIDVKDTVSKLDQAIPQSSGNSWTEIIIQRYKAKTEAQQKPALSLSWLSYIPLDIPGVVSRSAEERTEDTVRPSFESRTGNTDSSVFDDPTLDTQIDGISDSEPVHYKLLRNGSWVLVSSDE